MDLAKAALEVAIARGKATAKFPFAEKLFFTREALEQASSWEIAMHRAKRYRPFEHLADLGCSAGSDSLALAETAPTIGIDLDALRLSMAQANAQALGSGLPPGIGAGGHAQSFAALPGSEQAGAVLRPGRRSGGKRLRSVREYEPPLLLIRDWLQVCPALGVKISPGVKLAELQGYAAEIEFISLRGELKEAVLWFGALMTVERRATLLPGGYSSDGSAGREPGGVRAGGVPVRTGSLPCCERGWCKRWVGNWMRGRSTRISLT